MTITERKKATDFPMIIYSMSDESNEYINIKFPELTYDSVDSVS